MYIIKNAFRCIGRSVGRNLLIGIIVLVIAVSACLGLSIRQAAMSSSAWAAKNNLIDPLCPAAEGVSVPKKGVADEKIIR